MGRLAGGFNKYPRQRKAPKGPCDICGVFTHLCRDHDHVILRYRGRLCLNCNAGIGMLKDSPLIIQKALDYVSRDWSKGEMYVKPKRRKAKIKELKEEYDRAWELMDNPMMVNS